jgi:putative transposase
VWVTAKECVDLPGFASRAHNVRIKLDKLIQSNAEMRRKKEGSKEFEYLVTCLPKPAQDALFKRQMLEKVSKAPALAKTELVITDLTKAQRICADARAALCKAVVDLEIETCAARTKVIAHVVSDISLGIASPELLELAQKANARPTGKVKLGARTLNGWLLEYCKASGPSEVLTRLAPRPSRSKVKPIQVPWFTRFMAFYRDPRGLPATEVYEEFKEDWMKYYNDQPLLLSAVPSYDAVLRMLRKLPKVESLRGRVTGSAWRALQPYVRRDWSVLKTNDVWIGDGHGMKMTVRHPEHGQRFKPELTLIIDGVTRYIVGWSISYSENVIAVSDAMRHAIEQNGVPLFYYSDNGAGQTAKPLDAEVTGMLPRLGIGHETGIPGNPQGRGIIERVHKTILIRVARKFQTFNGGSADREWVRATSVAIDSALNAEKNGKELTIKQSNDLKKLPSWQQLIDAVEEGIEWYNTRHEHSELPKRANGKHYTPAQYRAEQLQMVELHYLTDAEKRDMFRPSFEVSTRNGEVRHLNNIYFSDALASYHGEKVHIFVDIHDANSVTVRTLDGVFICEAAWNGNKKAAFPVTMVENKREERAIGIKKRAEKVIEKAEAELYPNRTIEHAPDFSQLAGPVPVPAFEAVEEEPEFFFPSERAKWEEEQRKKKAG